MRGNVESGGHHHIKYFDTSTNDKGVLDVVDIGCPALLRIGDYESHTFARKTMEETTESLSSIHLPFVKCTENDLLLFAILFVATPPQ